MARSELVYIRRAFFSIFIHFVKILTRVLFRMEKKGLENFPTNEALILVSNHISNMDPVAVGLASPVELNYMAKKELFRNVLFRWLIVAFKAFPLTRGAVDRKAIARALKALKDREPLIMFPEGTRGDGKSIQTAKPGVGMIIYKAKVKVIPVIVKGTDKVLPRKAKFLHLHKLTIRFGRHLDLDRFYKMPECRETYELIAAEVTSGMRALFNQ